MKKKLALALAAVIAVCALSGCSQQETTRRDRDDGIDGESITEATTIDFEYKIVDGNVEITKYIGNDATVEIPLSIDGGNVVSIGEYAFKQCDKVSNILIPDSVTEIGRGAFYDCSGLTGITIPDSVTEIGTGAFLYCTGLTGVTIPDSVAEIGESAFFGCTGLTDITIPDSVTVIGEYAFNGCTGLTGIAIPDSVTVIGNSAFNGCTGLTSIEIPDSVTKIGGYAFSDCTGLTSIEIPDSVTEIGGYAPEIVGYDEIGFCLGYDCKIYVFDGCTGLKSIILNITHNIPAESETFIKEALVEFRNSQVKLTVNIPIGTGYAYRHYPGFDQERLTFVPCNRHK